MQQKVIYKAKVQIGTKIPPGTPFESDGLLCYFPVGINAGLAFPHDLVENSPDIFEKVIERESGKWYVGILKGYKKKKTCFK